MVSEKKLNLVQARLSDAELGQLEKLKKENGWSVSETIRNAIKQFAKGKKRRDAFR